MGNGQLGFHLALAFVDAPDHFVVLQGQLNHSPQLCSSDWLQHVSLRLGFAGPFDRCDISVGDQVDDWYVEALLKKLGGRNAFQRSHKFKIHQHDIWTQLWCSGNSLLRRDSDVEWPVAE